MCTPSFKKQYSAKTNVVEKQARKGDDGGDKDINNYDKDPDWDKDTSEYESMV